MRSGSHWLERKPLAEPQGQPPQNHASDDASLKQDIEIIIEKTVETSEVSQQNVAVEDAQKAELKAKKQHIVKKREFSCCHNVEARCPDEGMD